MECVESAWKMRWKCPERAWEVPWDGVGSAPEVFLEAKFEALSGQNKHRKPWLKDAQRGRATPRGVEPLRAAPNGFLVHHLNYSVTVFMPYRCLIFRFPPRFGLTRAGDFACVCPGLLAFAGIRWCSPFGSCSDTHQPSAARS